MYRIERKVGWAVALTIAALVIAVPQLGYGFAATAPLQEEMGKVEIHWASNRLVFDIKGSTTSFEAYPDGTFVHASSGANLSFDEGEPLRFEGVDGESAEIERLTSRDGKVLIYLDDAGRAAWKIGNRPIPLADGEWTNRRAGTSFAVEDERIIKCAGFEPKS